MGKLDAKTREYISRPAVFADLFNYLIYQGQPILKPEDLNDLDPTELAFPFMEESKSQPVQKVRDVLKQAVIKEDGQAVYLAVLGVENQTNVHYAMPVRNMLYDALHYAGQVARIAREHHIKKDIEQQAEYLSGFTKKDKLLPVVTLVVHFGQEPWDGPLSIHEMLDTENEAILRLVADYRIHLISPVSMDLQEIERFRSDFHELAEFIHCGRDKNALRQLVNSNDAFRHLDYLTAEIANDVTRSNVKLKRDQKGEVNMCVAIAELREEAKQEGILEGKQEGILEGKLEGILEGEQKMLFQLYQKGQLSLEIAVENSGMEAEAFQAACKLYFSEHQHAD